MATTAGMPGLHLLFRALVVSFFVTPLAAVAGNTQLSGHAATYWRPAVRQHNKFALLSVTPCPGPPAARAATNDNVLVAQHRGTHNVWTLGSGLSQLAFCKKRGAYNGRVARKMLRPCEGRTAAGKAALARVLLGLHPTSAAQSRAGSRGCSHDPLEKHPGRVECGLPKGAGDLNISICHRLMKPVRTLKDG